MMRRLPNSSRLLARTSVRAAATLTEVLMSLLIMGVGVLSVFSLYPIAVARSIQATQAVHSKVLVGNAQAEILADPAMLNGAPPWRPAVFYRTGDVVTLPPSDSDRFTSTPFRFVCTNNGVSGTSLPALMSIDPADRNYGNSQTAVNNGGAVFNDRDNDGTVDPGEVVWQRAVADTTGSLPAYGPNRSLESTVTVIDPYGWATIHQQFGNVPSRDAYGSAPRFDGGLRMLLDDGSTASRPIETYSGAAGGTVEDIFRPLFRYADDGGGTAAVSYPGSFDFTADNEELTAGQLRRVAMTKVALDGSYSDDQEPIPLVPGNFSAGGGTPARAIVTLDSTPESISLITELDAAVRDSEAADLPLFVRATFSSASAQATASRWLRSGFDDDGDGTFEVDAIVPGTPSIEVGTLPAAFGAATDTVMRFETFEPRYTWLATIARDTDGRIDEANGVVFFRRPFDEPLEVGFNAQIGNDPAVTTDDPENGSFDTAIATQNRSRAYIRNGRDDGTGAVGDDILPQVAVGRHIFDSISGRWYRIESIITSALGSAGATWVVELDRPADVIVRDPNQTLVANPVISDPQVVIPQGIVRIFDLELDR